MKTRLLAVIFWAAWLMAAIFLVSSPAWAWGPGVHIETSLFLFKHIILLAPFARKLLSSHPSEFIYGSISPDMVLGKKYMRPERNNHRWSVGFSVLDSARNEGQRAFALGYLSHLAADTVAHNSFIPDQILSGFDRRRRGHVTHELLFDAMLGDEVWPVVSVLSRRSFAECDRILRRKLPRTPLPKRVNQKIFRSGGVLVRTGGWEKIVRGIRRGWGHELSAYAGTPYLESVHDAVVEFINDPEQASCRRQCPTGGSVLREAESLRRDLKRMNKQDMLDREKYHSLVADFRKWREEQISGDADLMDPKPPAAGPKPAAAGPACPPPA